MKNPEIIDNQSPENEFDATGEEWKKIAKDLEVVDTTKEKAMEFSAMEKKDIGNILDYYGFPKEGVHYIKSDADMNKIRKAVDRYHLFDDDLEAMEGKRMRKDAANEIQNIIDKAVTPDRKR